MRQAGKHNSVLGETGGKWKVAGMGDGRRAAPGGTRPSRPLFLLGWSDPDPSKSMETKVLEAANRYQEKYQRRANFVLLAPGEVCAIPGMTIAVSPSCRSHTFFVGRDDELG